MWPEINRTASAAFDLWLRPIQGLPPLWQVALTALPLTAFALLIFRVASNQAGIASAKGYIKGYLLELWLYRDDLPTLLRAQARVILHAGTYLRYTLVPLAIMLVPAGLLIAQVESLYGYRSFAPGEAAILSVSLAARPAASLPMSPKLRVTGGLALETPPLRLEEGRVVMWRLRSRTAGDFRVVLEQGGPQVAIPIVFGGSGRRLARWSGYAGDWRMLAWPGAVALPADAGIAAVTVDYPRRGGEFAGLSSASWLMLGLSLVLGFVLRSRFGVTF